MNKETKKQYREKYNNMVYSLSLIERVNVLADIMGLKSLWDIKQLFMIDSTPFTLKDYEYIIWVGYVNIHNELEDSVVKYRINQKMTLEIFESSTYTLTLSTILLGVTRSDHPMFNYINTKRQELIATERMNTIKGIIKS